MKLIFNKSEFKIKGKTIKAPFPIRDAFISKKGVIVLMDLFATLEGPILDIREVRRIPKEVNLFCYSINGEVLWKAELPVGENTEDYYYKITSHCPLIVHSFSSFLCEIDPETGKILNKEFVK